MVRRNSISGMMSILVVALIFGSYGVFTRLTSDSFTAFTQALVKNGVAAILSIGLLILFRQKLHRPNRQELPWMVLWLATGIVLMLFSYIGFKYLPIGLTYFLIYSTMIISGMLTGRIVFGEKITQVKIMALILAILGLILIYFDSFVINLPAILILIGGVSGGIWNVISKKFSARYSDFELTVLDGLIGVLVGFTGMLILHQSLPEINADHMNVWLLLLGSGTLQVVSISLIVFGFKRIEAQVGSLILPIEVVFAVIFGYLVFKEMPSPLTLIGGALIGCAAILPGIEAIRQQRHKRIR